MPPRAVSNSSDMIAGFVSDTRSPTISRDGKVGCHATAVIATTEHHSSDATAGCAPSAHGENPVSGLAAPTMTCASSASAVITASGPSPLDSRR